MPGPFPGMDPYLEASVLWRSFHNTFIMLMASDLNRRLPAGFLAQPVPRVYGSFQQPRAQAASGLNPIDKTEVILATARQRSVGPVVLDREERLDAPEIIHGEEHLELYLSIIDTRRKHLEAVVIIELLSPTNKTEQNEGYSLYRRKKQQTCENGIHLLEIDLLRSGLHSVRVPEDIIRSQGEWDYLVTLFDATLPASWIFWRIELQSPLPALLLPLTQDVPAIRLDLQAILDRYFEENRATSTLDYTGEPHPPLSPPDAAWADALLREKGCRQGRRSPASGRRPSSKRRTETV